jgi:hypothetical protein
MTQKKLICADGKRQNLKYLQKSVRISAICVLFSSLLRTNARVACS